MAGGKGARMNSSTPKQFIELNGKPVLFHTLNAFSQYNPSLPIVLVLPEGDVETWNDLVKRYKFDLPVIVQTGGETRFQSVKKGLELLPDTGLVAIHDGVRPLVSQEIIGASFRLARVHKTAVASVDLKESIRMTDQTTTQAIDRSRFRLVQTPQTFDLALIKKAYQVKENPTMTDDATVAEQAGHPIALFEGSYDNLKITTAEDLILAEALLKRKS